MIGASKILTVSYGTFSCTLEGFDEPFSTMKAIAEYFRDLAAEDRYFGAVPPTPDAEMLHRIAEREIQRRVEAKISANGIVLRQAPAAQPATQTEPAIADNVALTPAPMIAEAAHVAAATPVVEPTPASPVEPSERRASAADQPVQADDDSITAKLARIRAAVSASRGAAAAVAAAPVVATVATAFDDSVTEDDEQDQLFAADDAAGAQSFSFDIDLPDIGHHATDDHGTASEDDTLAVSADFVEPAIDLEAAPALQDDLPEAAPTAEVEDEDVSPAVDLTSTEDQDDEEWSARLDAAAAEPVSVMEYDTEDAVMDDTSAVEDTDDLVARLSRANDIAEEVQETDDASATSAEVLDWEDEDTAAVLRADPEGDEWSEDGAVADDDLADLAALDGASADVQDDVADEDTQRDIVSADIPDSAIAATQSDDGVAADLTGETGAAEPAAASMEENLASLFRQTAETAVAADEEEADAGNLGHDDQDAHAGDQIAAQADSDLEDQMPAAAEAVPPVTTARPGFLSRARARVIKVRKAAETDLAADVLPDADVPARSIADEAAEFADAAYGRTAEAVAEPADEPVDTLILGQSAEDQSGHDTPEAIEGHDGHEVHDGRAILESAAPDNDEGVSRLMDEAATKLEGAENRRRFSAISHLKAAVAATVADRKLKPQDAPTDPRDDVDDLGLYRDDLSKAVRPRRPVAESATTATRRPAVDTRPAPLVLVSEQRVDTPDDMRAAGAVIRPRRISTGTMVLAEEADDNEDNDDPISPEEAANFAEFAERLGASSLTELLEAAAAYTASVEGHPHFSRPQILKKVAHVTDDNDFTREDGLRSFGMLLRQGKIQKVRRGQFALTESSRFKSEARRVAH